MTPRSGVGTLTHGEDTVSTGGHTPEYKPELSRGGRIHLSGFFCMFLLLFSIWPCIYNSGKIINIPFLKVHFAELFSADREEAKLTNTALADQAAIKALETDVWTAGLGGGEGTKAMGLHGSRTLSSFQLFPNGSESTNEPTKPILETEVHKLAASLLTEHGPWGRSREELLEKGTRTSHSRDDKGHIEHGRSSTAPPAGREGSPVRPTQQHPELIRPTAHISPNSGKKRV